MSCIHIKVVVRAEMLPRDFHQTQENRLLITYCGQNSKIEKN